MDRRSFIGGTAVGAAAMSVRPAFAAGEEALAKAIADRAASKSFSGTILVARGGKPVYRGAFGHAELAFGAPCAIDTRYRIASITKLFTATLILRLEAQGKLGLDRTIRTCLPRYTGEGADKVTIRQLLNHTSGIANFDTVTSYEAAVRDGIPSYQLPQSSDALLDKFASGKLVREPGKAFEYNNADYIILGKIVEALTGLDYDAALRREITGPLGLGETGLLFQNRVMPRLASTYFQNGEQPLINDMPVYMENWYAAGGMYSTVTDLLGFANGLYGGKLIARPQLDALLTPGLDDYGFGLWIASLKVGEKRHRFAQRPGSIMGANATLLHFPDDALTIVILANTNKADIDAFGFHIARTALA